MDPRKAVVDVSAFGGHAEAGERCDELQANGCALELLSTSKAGIPFPGTTYPEVNRLGQVTLRDSVTRLGNGDPGDTDPSAGRCSVN